MEKIEQQITKMQGIFDCLLMQGKINMKLSRLLSAGLKLIYQSTKMYTKPKSKASFSEVEKYVNKHINMADTEILEAELNRRQELNKHQ